MKLTNLILATLVLVSSNVAFATDCKAKNQSSSLFSNTLPNGAPTLPPASPGIITSTVR